MTFSSNVGSELGRWASAYDQLQILGEEGFYELSPRKQYELFSDLPPPILFDQFLALRIGVSEETPIEYNPKKELFDKSHKFIPTDDQERLCQEHLEEQKRRSKIVSFGRTPEYTSDGRLVKTLFGYVEFACESGMYELAFKRILSHLQESPNLSLKYLAMRRAKDVKKKAESSIEPDSSDFESFDLK